MPRGCVGKTGTQIGEGPQLMEHDRPSEIRSALLAGRLEGFSLPDLLWSLCRCQGTGVLRVSSGEFEKAVYMEEGRIVFASSSDPDDRLGEQFLRGGLIKIDQLDQAVSQLSSGKRLGALLVESESIRPEQLVQGVLTQVETIVLDLFEWEEGDYRFEEGPLPTEEVIKLGIKTSELLIRGIRQLRSFSRVRRSVGASQKVYGLTDAGRGLLDGVTLTAGEESLVERLTDGEASIEDLCHEVFLSNYEIYQTMWALKVLGVVEEREELWMAPSDVTQQGSLSQVDFTELLVRLGRGGETGVLYVTKGEHERSLHISGGRCVFATSNDADDSLLTYLLRRGVISLRDREETGKRLLSNKRVGTILREMGVIDEHDLKGMVREQLSEIVYDTFRWTDAQYAFVCGPLPTVEEITLEADLDALVARGIRRVSSWSRVWHGCGGLEVPLELKPTYLSVLDAMGAGPNEWEVIAALKVPRTPRQICTALDLPDFRVCQILWAMRVLGGLEVVSAEEAREAELLASADAAPSSSEAEDDEPQVETAEDRFEDEVPVAIAGPEIEHEPQIEAVEIHEVEVEDTPHIEVVEIEDSPQIELVRDVDAPVETTMEETILAMESSLDDAPVAVAVAVSVEAVDEESPFEVPSADTTQVISREVLEAAIGDPDVLDRPPEAVEFEPLQDSTQVIPKEVIEAAVAGEESEQPTPPVPDSDELDLEEAPDGESSTLKLVRNAVDNALQFQQGGTEVSVDSDDGDCAITGEAEAVLPVDDGWECPEGVDRAIARFNAVQRVVYRTVRAEVGAGAINFIRSCCSHLPEDNADALEGVDLQADGSWDAEGLRNAIRVLRLEDPSTLYQTLIEHEIDQLRQFIGDAKVVELQRQVEQVEQADAAI